MNSRCRTVRAVRLIDSPPSINRLIGLRWLLHKLYPDAATGDLKAEIAAFCKLFYQVDLSAADLDRLAG